MEFIENISAGNVRTANEFLTTFIGSGHVDTKKILDQDNVHLSQNQGKRYTVSYHEFLRAIIFKDNAYYYPDATQIVNIFDLSQVDFKEHFLMPTILDFFFRYSNKSENEGFITTSSLVKYLMDLGFNSDQIEHAIIRALNKDLIESEGRKKPSVGDPHPLHLRITTVGAYHITKLVKSFVYIDAILIDVPILDDYFRKEIQDVDKIGERLSRSGSFCDYLDKAWSSTNNLASGFNWTEASASIRKDIEIVKSRIIPKS